MLAFPRTSRRGPARSRRPAARLHLETLEARTLLSAAVPVPPGPTLDQAAELVPGQEAVATLPVGPAGSGVENWFHFHLDDPSAVTLATNDQAEIRSLVPVLSLFNNQEPYDPGNPLTDPNAPFGHLLLAQVSGTPQTPDATITRQLGPGDYYVAVSGAGDLYFNPFLADSGYPGSTGDYSLQLTVQPLALDPTVPAVLATSPAPGASLSSSPFVIRLDLSADLDPSLFGQVNLSVTSLISPQGPPQPVPVTYTYSPQAHELQLDPATALKPGVYSIVIGSDAGGQPVLANPSGLSLTFRVTGNEGNPVGPGDNPAALADDTPPYAHDLGDVTNSGLVQAVGAIGDDYIDDATPFDANNVDMYRFEVSGPGQYVLTAEVFAGRIDSPLNAAVSLYQVNPDGSLTTLAGNADSGNTTSALTDQGVQIYPLSLDPVITAGLTSGTYILAVSGYYNVPDATVGLSSASGGVFDPLVTHSGVNGFTTGRYVLNFQVQPHQGTPEVVAVTRDDGITPGGPPTQFVVQFSEPMNLRQLAYAAYQNYAFGLGPNQMPAVFVQDLDPAAPQTFYYPRLESYDAGGDQATFVMFDGLPSGTYQLHLSGANGLADLAGNPLTDSLGGSGDYLYTYTVSDPARDAGASPLVLSRAQGTDAVQDLGPLFPNELAAGVTLTRDFSSNPDAVDPGNTQDVYEFQVLQAQTYTFNLTDQSGGLLAGVVPVLSTDPDGLNTLPGSPQGGANYQYLLSPGTYYLRVGPWSGVDPGQVKYGVQIAIVNGLPEQPMPLTVGAAPAIRIRLNPVAPLPPPGPVAPASPSAPPSPAVATGGAGIPSSVLLALGTGSLGGSRSPDAGGFVVPGVSVLDRVVAQAPRFLRSDEFVQVVSLLQGVNNSLTDNDSPGPNASGLVGWPAGPYPPLSPLRQAVELLFQLWNLRESTASDLFEAEPLEEETDPTGLPLPDSADGGTDVRLTALAAAGVVFGLGLPGALDRDEKKQRGAPRTPSGGRRTHYHPDLPGL